MSFYACLLGADSLDELSAHVIYYGVRYLFAIVHRVMYCYASMQR